MSETSLKIEWNGGFALITLNRPEKRNAISPEMVRELHAALDEIETGSAHGAVLTGSGKAFCAGMDLAVLRGMAEDAAAPGDADRIVQDARRMADFFRRLYSFPKPLIAAVNGAALAGGCLIATLCDFTLACPEAQFGYTEVRIGFMPALVAIFLLRQIGEKRARDLLLSGRIVDAAEAGTIGLVSEVVPREKLLERARELAATLASFSPASLASTKRLILDLGKEELDRQLEISVRASARMRSTTDFREGLSAFLEKRKPEWSRVQSIRKRL